MTLSNRLASAIDALAQIEHLGCRVLHVSCSPWQPRAVIQIANAEPLQDWLDARQQPHYLYTPADEEVWIGRAALGDCDVLWVMPRPPRPLWPSEDATAERAAVLPDHATQTGDVWRGF